MKHSTTRRDFLKTTTVAGFGVWIAGTQSVWAQSASPNEKLNIGAIGCGGRGWGDIEGVASENIVALCDVDWGRAKEAVAKYPNARRYSDFRKMLEEGKDLDAVVIGAPDHVHAPAACMAMALGKHVYCEKPLTHTVYEARVVRETASYCNVKTQMGNQGHAGDRHREAVEVIRSGAIGTVREIHSWTNRPIWPQGIERPEETPPVPQGLDWDAFIGPAPMRPYHAAYHPFKWRGWWDFGCGALGDMGCHNMDLAFWSLDLQDPISLEVLSHSGVNAETAPKWSVIRYEFGPRGDRPALTLTWYDGGKKPAPELLEVLEVPADKPVPATGNLFIGDRGKLFCGEYGADYRLLPRKDFEGYQPPAPTIPRVGGKHHQEWIAACKGGPEALSNFDYAGRFTEMVNLGNTALRAGKPFKYFGPNLKIYSDPTLEQYLQMEYRQGYSLSEFGGRG